MAVTPETVTITIEPDLSKLIEALTTLEEGFQDLAQKTRATIEALDDPDATFDARTQRSMLLPRRCPVE